MLKIFGKILLGLETILSLRKVAEDILFPKKIGDIIEFKGKPCLIVGRYRKGYHFLGYVYRVLKEKSDDCFVHLRDGKYQEAINVTFKIKHFYSREPGLLSISISNNVHMKHYYCFDGDSIILHREDGCAVECKYIDGSSREAYKKYNLNDLQYTEEKYDEIIQKCYKNKYKK